MYRARFVLLALVAALVAGSLTAGEALAQAPVIKALDDSPGPRWAPSNVTVEAGDTVEWNFDDALVQHDVQSSSPNWTLSTPSLPPGAPPVSFTFEDPGTYTFICSLHGASMSGSVTVEAAAEPLANVLVVSKTAGFRHSSIDEGIAAIQQLGTANDFTVDVVDGAMTAGSSDPQLAAAFTDATLAQYDVVVFLSTTGDILTVPMQEAFERYIQGGGGYAGVHAASDTEYTWPWYGQLVGGYFRSHPPGTPTADVDVTDGDEPSTTGLPASWTRTDEWYNFQDISEPVVNGSATVADFSPRASQVHVLATVDESSYDEQDGNTVDDDHPVAWCSDFDGGRSWYTAMGHTEASFADADFRRHLLGGLQTAAGVDADCGEPRETAPTAADFEKVTLDDDTNAPMEIDIANDGRAFYIELDGRVQMWSPTTGTTTTVGTIPVSVVHENGLIGIQLAPDFDTTGHIYLAYNTLPNEDANGMGTNRVSRFTLTGTTLGQEQIIYTWQHQREQCCHTGGSLDFGPDGSLYLSTGDNTNPFAHGFNPTDERPGRESLGRPAHVGQHEQPERQDPALQADPGRHRRAGHRDDVHDPGRQHVPGRHGADPAGDLRDGLPQPVPDPRRPEDRLGADGRLRPGRRLGRPRPRPAGQRRVQRGQGAGLLRLALLRPRERAVPRHHLRGRQRQHGHRQRHLRLQRAGQRLAQQHGPDQPAAGDPGHHVGGLHRGGRPLPRPRHGRRPDRGPALLLRRGQHVRQQVPALLRRPVVHRRVEQRLGQDGDAQRPGPRHRRELLRDLRRLHQPDGPRVRA